MAFYWVEGVARPNHGRVPGVSGNASVKAPCNKEFWKTGDASAQQNISCVSIHCLMQLLFSRDLLSPPRHSCFHKIAWHLENDLYLGISALYYLSSNYGAYAFLLKWERVMNNS